MRLRILVHQYLILIPYLYMGQKQKISPQRIERRTEGYEPTELPLLQGDLNKLRLITIYVFVEIRFVNPPGECIIGIS
jgi:hypothetical protein